MSTALDTLVAASKRAGLLSREEEAALIERATRMLSQLPHAPDWEIVFIDDGSRLWLLANLGRQPLAAPPLTLRVPCRAEQAAQRIAAEGYDRYAPPAAKQ